MGLAADDSDPFKLFGNSRLPALSGAAASRLDRILLNTLIKMKAQGYAREAISLLHSDKVWTRRLAKKYVDRYSKSR